MNAEHIHRLFKRPTKKNETKNAERLKKKKIDEKRK